MRKKRFGICQECGKIWDRQRDLLCPCWIPPPPDPPPPPKPKTYNPGAGQILQFSFSREDLFAAAALTGLCVRGEAKEFGYLAAWADSIAEKMMERRN